ncbi:MAG: hypothetical protein V4508_18465 [Pseudomonadota bacterium]
MNTSWWWVAPSAKVARTTVDEGVVKMALKQSKNPIISAAISEYGWLVKHCPEFDELMAPPVLTKAINKPKKTSGAKENLAAGHAPKFLPD